VSNPADLPVPGWLEAEFGAPDEPIEARLLETHVVVGIEAIDADDPSSFREQRERRVHTDEACASRHQDGHVGADAHRARRRRSAGRVAGARAWGGTSHSTVSSRQRSNMRAFYEVSPDSSLRRSMANAG